LSTPTFFIPAFSAPPPFRQRCERFVGDLKERRNHLMYIVAFISGCVQR